MHGGVRVTLQKAMCLRLSETWPSGGSAMPVSMKTLSCALHVPDLGLSGLLLTRWWSRVRRHFSHGPISTTFRPEHISPYVVIPAGGPAGRWSVCVTDLSRLSSSRLCSSRFMRRRSYEERREMRTVSRARLLAAPARMRMFHATEMMRFV